MKKLYFKIVTVLVLVGIISTLFLPVAKAEFPDVRPDFWCYEKINDFSEMGYVKGYEDGEFKPNRTITRAEYVTIVNNFFGYETSDAESVEFIDVSESDWFAPYVAEAVRRGYISGYPDGTFRPYEPIRRQEATVILAKILNIHDEEFDEDHEDGLGQFNDSEDVDTWAYKAVHSYAVYDFINGYEDGTIKLFRNVTRAETVQLLNTVEEKVIIDRENKTNEIKDRPSGSKKRVVTPVITVVEENDTNDWFNGYEAPDKIVNVSVTTTTRNADIDVKVNGVDKETTKVEPLEGSEVQFTLEDGIYEITATARRSGYRTSGEAKKDVEVDTIAPIVNGKVNLPKSELPEVIEIEPGAIIAPVNRIMALATDMAEDEVVNTTEPTKEDVVEDADATLEDTEEDTDSTSEDADEKTTVTLFASDERSGLGELEYAWFVMTEDGYMRVSNWISLRDQDDAPVEEAEYVIDEFPVEPQTYYIGVKGSDIAGNLIEGEFTDTNIDKKNDNNPDGKVTDEEKDSPYDIIDEVPVDDEEDRPIVVVVKGTLTIHYVFENGSKAEEDYKKELERGESCEVNSPEIEGHTPNKASVSATMQDKDIEETVIYTINKYTITWLDDDKTELEVDENVPYGTMPSYDGEEPSKEPTAEFTFEFDDWDPEIEEVTDDAIYMATYTETTNKYTVTWENYDGTVLEVDEGVEYGTMPSYDGDAPVKNVTGFTSYWTNGWTPTVAKVEGDITYTATYRDAVNSYTIKFDTKGGTEIAPIVANFGEKVTAPADPTKDGYTFDGWDKVIPETMPAEDMTITASWTANDYTVSYEYGEDVPTGAPTLPAEKDYATDSIVEVEAEPELEGYTFSGWTTEDAEVTDGEFTMPAGNVQFTGIWRANEYTVSYEYEEGAPTGAPELPADNKYATDSIVDVEDEPTLDGYTFSGWTTEDVTVEDDVFTMPAGDVEFTGTWTANEYTVSYEYGEDVPTGAPTLPADKDYATDSIVEVEEEPELEGYTFSGWTTTDATVEDGEFTMPAGDVEFTGIWRANEYTVSYVYGEDAPEGAPELPADKDYPTDSLVDVEAKPELKGYTFSGWTTTDATVEDDEFTMPAGDVEFTGTWEKDASKWHEVEFKAGENGTLNGETKYTDILTGTKFEDAEIIIPTPVPAEDYEFDSWEPSTPTNNTVVNGDLTFTATFKKVWVAPDVRIDSFESTNVTNDDGNKAEPGTEIEYEVIIKNHDDFNALIDIIPEDDMTIVSPEDYTDLILTPDEEIKVTVRKTVPEDFDIAKQDFVAKISVAIKNNDGDDEEIVTETAENEIEKTTIVKSGEAVDKNIVLTIDISGSMLFCPEHNDSSSNGREYRYSSTYSFPGGYSADAYDYEGNRWNPRIKYKYSSMPFIGHEVNVNGNWVKCSCTQNRIEIVKDALSKFIDKIYAASVANDEKVTITVVTFNSEAKTSTTYLLSEDNIGNVKSEISNINVEKSGTNIRAGVQKATSAFDRANILKDGAKNYSVFFGDGKPSNDTDNKPRNTDYNNLKNKVDYSYAIGFGPDFASTTSDAYEILENLIKGDGIKVHQASNATDVANAFADIATSIATSQQSVDGEIVVTLPNDEGKYYPITATYNDDGSIETLFTITAAEQLAENDIEIVDGELTWNISGSKYSIYKGLSLKIGDELATGGVMKMMMVAPPKMLIIEAPLSEEIEEVEEEVTEAEEVVEEVSETESVEEEVTETEEAVEEVSETESVEEEVTEPEEVVEEVSEAESAEEEATETEEVVEEVKESESTEEEVKAPESAEEEIVEEAA